jgi:acetyl esterase/lipase
MFVRQILWLLAVLPVLAVAGAHSNAPPPAEPLTPVPGAISEQAQTYYRSWRPRPAGKSIDWRDPQQAAFMRKMLGRMFERSLAATGLEYRLERADTDRVEAYWVRVPDRVVHSGRSLIYLHGGGYVLGSAQTNLVTPIRVSRAAGMPVLSVEYRLAPEHPFPAGVEDALAAYTWLLDKGNEPQSIGVFGDSAGGGLTIALALKIREAGLPQPGALVVLSPSVDATASGDTQATLQEFDIVLGPPDPDRSLMYAGTTPLTHPMISPVYADLTGLPPLLIQVGTRERLLSDSARLARNARRDGVDVTLDVWDGMWHVWQDHPTIPEATQATAEIGAFFADRLRPRMLERAVRRE